MTETPAAVPPTTPPPKEDETKKTPSSPNGAPTKKFEGDGVPFKGKLIGMEDLSVDRDEKICLDSMFKLKAVVKARGEHKQKIQINLTMTAVKVVDDITKVQIASHDIERISFVVIDPRDTRAFGYIYNTSDDRHQFWAIKTERSAAATVLALKELFELAFEQYTNLEKAKAANAPPAPTPPVVAPIPVQAPTPVPPTPEPLLFVSEPTTPIVPPPQQPPAVVAPAFPPPPVQPAQATKSLLDDNLWGGNTQTTTAPAPPLQQTQPQPPGNVDLFGLDEPVLRPAPTPKVHDPLADMFNPMAFTTPTQQHQSPPASSDGGLFGVFANVAPPPVTQPNPYSNMFAQPPRPQQQQQQQQLPPYFPSPPMPQQPQQSQFPFVSQPLLPAPLLSQQQQPDVFGTSSLSPVAPPTVTNPFSGLDLLGDFTSAPAAKPLTKDAFFPVAPSVRSMQELQMQQKP